MSETQKSPNCSHLQRSVNEAAHSVTHGTTNCHIAAYQENTQEDKGCCRHGVCNECTLQRRSTVSAICQQRLICQQSMTRLVAKQIGMAGTICYIHHGDAAGLQHRTLYYYAYDRLQVCTLMPMTDCKSAANHQTKGYLTCMKNLQATNASRCTWRWRWWARHNCCFLLACLAA